MRLDTCHSTNSLHVEHSDAIEGQSWNLYSDGVGLFVGSLLHQMNGAAD